jgi:hypothetical protein
MTSAADRLRYARFLFENKRASIDGIKWLFRVRQPAAGT